MIELKNTIVPSINIDAIDIQVLFNGDENNSHEPTN